MRLWHAKSLNVFHSELLALDEAEMLPQTCQMTRPPLGPKPSTTQLHPSSSRSLGTHKSQQARQIYETTLTEKL